MPVLILADPSNPSQNAFVVSARKREAGNAPTALRFIVVNAAGSTSSVRYGIVL
jgi:hypothetical protein